MPKRYFQNFAPRWIIFSCDIVLISLSFILSFFLIHRFSINSISISRILPGLFTNLVIGTVCIVTMAIYKGIIRYSEIKDIVRIIKFAFLQLGLWMVIYLPASNNSSITHMINIPLLLINLFAV